MSDEKQKKRFAKGELVHEDFLAWLAYIFGNLSAASRALAELRNRRREGEQVECRSVDRVFVVGPKVEEPKE